MRTKTPVVQVDEVLVKILCHNVVCLVQAIYELGLEPVFAAAFGTRQRSVPEIGWNQGFRYKAPGPPSFRKHFLGFPSTS